MGLPRLAIVSLHAHREFAPRGERTRRVAEALGRDWEVEIVAPPPDRPTGGASGRGTTTLIRRGAARVLRSALLDKWEPWSLRRLRRWRPQADAALLIGHPFSPVAYAARRLAAAGVPYVVDSGDPWCLTARVPPNRGVGLLRARAAERFVWSHAAGAVLTTPGQATELAALFPELEILVRPNGYQRVAPPGPRSESSSEELRVIHLGMLSRSRVDVGRFLAGLCESRRWRRVVVAQFGDDFSGALDAVPDCVDVERHGARPWPEIVRRSVDYDLALVVGHQDPTKLPSKAIQYLTLPIPRLALTSGLPQDSLSSYAAAMPGWLVLPPGEPTAAARVAEHLGQAWGDGRLDPPPGESWPAVARVVADFVGRRVGVGAQR